jgi:hypothetical protein
MSPVNPARVEKTIESSVLSNVILRADYPSTERVRDSWNAFPSCSKEPRILSQLWCCFPSCSKEPEILSQLWCCFPSYSPPVGL